MQNFIFFDIDGTIISEDGYLPESAVRAIQAARKKGNATFINTGRTAMNVDPFLREIGFNGYVYGCGTELEYDGKVLFHEKQTPACSREMVELVRRTNVAVLYERSDAMFIDRSTRILPYLQDLLNLYESKHVTVSDLPDDADWYTDKFVIWYDEQSDLAAFQAGLTGKFDYIDRGNHFAEMVPCGCSKATGMEKMMQLPAWGGRSGCRLRQKFENGLPHAGSCRHGNRNGGQPYATSLCELHHRKSCRRRTGKGTGTL